MPKIITLSEIKQALKDPNLIRISKEGFVAYSQGNVVVPPVGEMLLDGPKEMSVTRLSTAHQMVK